VLPRFSSVNFDIIYLFYTKCILSKTLKVIPCEKKRIWSSAKLLDEPVGRVQFGIIVEEYQICLVTGNYVLFIFTVLSEFEFFLYIFLEFSSQF